MITEDSRDVDVEFSDSNLEMRVVIRVTEGRGVSAARILDTAHDLLGASLAGQGYHVEQVSAVLDSWHRSRANESRQMEEF